MMHIFLGATLFLQTLVYVVTVQISQVKVSAVSYFQCSIWPGIADKYDIVLFTFILLYYNNTQEA